MHRPAAALVAVALVSAALARPAQAQPTIDGGWSEFEWNASGLIEPPFDSFTLSSANPFTIRLVDCCLIGDQLRLDWTGSSVGSLQTGPFGPDGDQSGASDGDAAWAHPGLSKGSAFFAAGTYDFTLLKTRTAPGTTTGAGFIDATTTLSAVPEPSTVALVAGGVLVLAGVARRRRPA